MLPFLQHIIQGIEQHTPSPIKAQSQIKPSSDQPSSLTDYINHIIGFHQMAGSQNRLNPSMLYTNTPDYTVPPQSMDFSHVPVGLDQALPNPSAMMLSHPTRQIPNAFPSNPPINQI